MLPLPKRGNQIWPDVRWPHPPSPASSVCHVRFPRLPTLLFSWVKSRRARNFPSRSPPNPPKQRQQRYPENMAGRHTKLASYRHPPQSIGRVLQSCKSQGPSRSEAERRPTPLPYSRRNSTSRVVECHDPEIRESENCPPRSIPSRSRSPPRPILRAAPEGPVERNFPQDRST